MENKVNTTSNNTDQQPQEGVVAPLIVKRQFLKDFSFENPNASKLHQFPKTMPDVSVSVNVGVKPQEDQENDFEVILHLNAQSKYDQETAFIAELAYGGIFTCEEKNQQVLRAILLVEAPRILFPFARNILADATRDGGFPPLLLQPIDFIELYKKQVASEQQQQKVA